MNPVIRSCSFCLIHTPDLVRYGSKPRRLIADDPSYEKRLVRGLRSFPAALAYPPNQTFIGNLTPEQLGAVPRPWYQTAESASAADPSHDRALPEKANGPQSGTDERREQSTAASPTGPFGEIIAQDLFYALLKQADVLQPPLVKLDTAAARELQSLLSSHPVLKGLDRGRWQATAEAELAAELASGEALALLHNGLRRGCVSRDVRAEGREDDNLTSHILLEALSTKASAAIALHWLLHREGLTPDSIDFLISCGEEAAGDRYQRGGGGMAKAVGELCGCVNASGMDVKNFCAAPASALVTAAALVQAGVYQRVAVVAGGSLAKLGMKAATMLNQELPVLGDCLGCMAFLVTRDDGVSPILHLEPGAVGTARIGSSVSDEAVYRQLITAPLAALGLTMTDVDRYAPELHNAELMEYSGSGDVARKNYRMIAALGVRSGVLGKADMAQFIERVGMVGFAPPQGHIPSGVAYLGHALQALRAGRLKRVMVLSKASLFLNRLTDLYDGVSFLLEANPGATVDYGKQKK